MDIEGVISAETPYKAFSPDEIKMITTKQAWKVNSYKALLMRLSALTLKSISKREYRVRTGYFAVDAQAGLTHYVERNTKE